MNIVGMRYKTFIVSAVAIILSLIFLITPGLNLGIDFTGGTLLERSVTKAVSVDEIRKVLNDDLPELEIGNAMIQKLDQKNEFIIRTRELSSSEIIEIDKALADAFGEVDQRRTAVVYPVIGRELISQAVVAMIIASIGILIYISFRFEFKFAVIAVAALLHDVIIIIGIFALFRKEINSTFIAAILTVVGYSINDTIVIFDRIRDNLGFRKKESDEVLVNNSINQSISRTINTSLTTFIVVVLLFLFGGASISDFALALVLGVIIGSFSSLFIAAPLWLEWTRLSKQRRK